MDLCWKCKGSLLFVKISTNIYLTSIISIRYAHNCIEYIESSRYLLNLQWRKNIWTTKRSTLVQIKVVRLEATEAIYNIKFYKSRPGIQSILSRWWQNKWVYWVAADSLNVFRKCPFLSVASIGRLPYYMLVCG